MRTTNASFSLAAIGLALGAGCNWMEFDELADETWVRSTHKPSVGSTDYAIAAVGVTTSGTGGLLAVLGNDSPSYTTLEYDAAGKDSVGPNPQKLGVHFIAALSEPPIFLTDGTGKIAIVERAIDAGNIAVVIGPATAVADTPFASPNPPDAATFAGANLIIAAGNNLYTSTGIGAPTACTAADVGGMPFIAAALASDGTTLWAWTSTGVFAGYDLMALASCAGGTISPTTPTLMTTGFAPAPGARIHLTGNFAVLAAHAPGSRQGQVNVVERTGVTLVSGPLAADGLHSSTLATFGTSTYVAIGFPDHVIDGLVAGRVDLHAVDTTTGALTASPALRLHDATPEAGGLFGRVVTTMKFNDKQILVVGGGSEVFAYYRTSLYDALP